MSNCHETLEFYSPISQTQKLVFHCMLRNVLMNTDSKYCKSTVNSNQQTNGHMQNQTLNISTSTQPTTQIQSQILYSPCFTTRKVSQKAVSRQTQANNNTDIHQLAQLEVYTHLYQQNNTHTCTYTHLCAHTHTHL